MKKKRTGMIIGMICLIAILAVFFYVRKWGFALPKAGGDSVGSARQDADVGNVSDETIDAGNTAASGESKEAGNSEGSGESKDIESSEISGDREDQGTPVIKMPDDNPADDKTEISSQSGMTGPDNPETDKDESEPEEDDTISIIMVGDILLHIPVDASAKREDGTYDFNAIFSETKDDIEKADLALVNQEVIIGGEELGVSGYPAFNAPYEIADALVDNGFDVILHATNHALDKGKKGIQNCTANWEEKYPDIAYIGIAANEEKADEIYVYEDKGIKIAILNYTYGTNGIPLPSDMPYAVNLLKESRVKEDIQRAEELADFTIVCPHWGIEYSLETSAEQEKWAKLFLENGVDLVIGTHPHVIEPIEIYERENGEKMLVYYSLGNYVNWTSGTGAKVSKRMLGGMAKVTVGRDEDGKVVIEDYGVEALVCDLHKGEDGVKVYPLSEYSEEMAAENAIVRQADGFSYEYLVSLCNDIWGEMWE